MLKVKTIFTRGLLTLAVAGAGFLTLARIADAGCAIDWDLYNTTCEVVDYNHNFAFVLETTWIAQNKPAWTLIHDHWETANIDAHIDTHSTSIPPTGPLPQGDEVEVPCWGELTDSNDGLFKLNAADGTGFECSGSHDVTIKPYNSSCP